jgi:hypothetical protein
MTQEIWKSIKGYEGLYEVSNIGKIKSLEKLVSNGKKYILKKERILIKIMSSSGYYYVNLYKNKKSKVTYIHRIVVENFIPNVENKSQVNHIDGNKKNNCISNLEWCTRIENAQHALKNGLFPVGERGNSKLNAGDILKIREDCLNNPYIILAKKYSVSPELIKLIAFGKLWKHIPYPEKKHNVEFLKESNLHKGKKGFSLRVKLTEDKVREIKKLKNIKQIEEIAKLYNVTWRTVRRIMNGKTWSWVEAA